MPIRRKLTHWRAGLVSSAAEPHATAAPVVGAGERPQTAQRLVAVHPPQPSPTATPAAAPVLPTPPALGAGETKPAPLPLEIRPAPIQPGLPGLWRYTPTSRATRKPDVSALPACTDYHALSTRPLTTGRFYFAGKQKFLLCLDRLRTVRLRAIWWRSDCIRWRT